MTASALCVCTMLTLLGIVHFYWALGGRAGKDGAIPSRDGRAVLFPGPTMTACVGVALFGMAGLVGAAAGLIPAPVPASVLRGASGLLALVFLARAIGDFRYVGFFKRVKGSLFAKRDTMLYAPLCLALAVLIGVVAVG